MLDTSMAVVLLVPCTVEMSRRSSDFTFGLMPEKLQLIQK